MRTSPIAWLSLAAASAVLLTGCGTTEAPAADPADSVAPTSTPTPVSLTDSRGTTIDLDGPATKVVALEWNAAESLVALGVMPIGVAGVTDYASYVTAAPLDETVTDVGQRGEPSVDAIAGLAPDLVVATNDISDSALTQIEKIAPVLVLRAADASDGIGQMEKNLDLMATATGTTDRAASLIDELDAKITEGKAALSAAGLDGAPFALSDAFVDGSQIYIRPYFAGSLLSDVTERLGLVNAWEGEGDADYGLGSSDVEGLTKLPDDVNFLYLGQSDSDVYTKELADNAIWTGLPFVTDDKVFRLAPGIWGFGGPASMEAYIDAVVDSLTA